MSTNAQPAADSPVGYLDLIRGNRNFRYLWFGQIVSLLGDWFNLIASASLVANLTESGLAVSGLLVARLLAPFFVSPFAGVAADRLPRKSLLIWSDILRGVTVLGFLLVREPSQVWLLYVLTAVQLGISGFFFPTKTAMLPDIVSERELGAANALSSATWSVMLALGAALGGLAAGVFGLYPAFILDALTFVLSAFLIARIDYQAAVPLAQRAGESFRAALAEAVGQYVDGLLYLWQHRDILVIVLLKAFVSLLMWGPYQVIQITLSEQLYVIGAGGTIGLGLMYAANGVGTGIGPLGVRRFTGDRARALRVAIALAFVVSGVGMFLVAPLPSFGWFLVGLLLRGIGGGTIWVFSTQLLLEKLPNRVRGRVFATEFALHTLAGAIAAFLVGPALDAVGLDATLWTLAWLIVVPVAGWSWWTFGRSGAVKVAGATGD